jgi:hypothetical protein
VKLVQLNGLFKKEFINNEHYFNFLVTAQFISIHHHGTTRVTGSAMLSIHYSFSIYTGYKPSGIILTFPCHPKPPHTLIHSIIVLYHVIITYLNIIYVAEPCLIDMDAVVMIRSAEEPELSICVHVICNALTHI